MSAPDPGGIVRKGRGFVEGSNRLKEYADNSSKSKRDDAHDGGADRRKRERDDERDHDRERRRQRSRSHSRSRSNERNTKRRERSNSRDRGKDKRRERSVSRSRSGSRDRFGRERPPRQAPQQQDRDRRDGGRRERSRSRDRERERDRSPPRRGGAMIKGASNDIDKVTRGFYMAPLSMGDSERVFKRLYVGGIPIGASEWDIFHAIREAGEAAVDTGAGLEYPPTPAGDAGAGAAVSTDATTADKGEAKAGEQAAADGDGSAPEVQSGDAAGAGAAASSTSGAASEPAAPGAADGIVAQVGDGAEQKPVASAETAALSSSASDAAGAVGSGDGESKSAASKAEPDGGLSEAAALKKKLDDLRDACKPHRQRMVLAVSTGGRDRNFGFIDLPSAAVADLILSLDGKVTCNGCRLMISRPRDYPRPARGTGAGAGGDDQWGRVGAGRDQQRDGRGVGSGDVGSSSGGMAIPRKAAQPTDGSAPGSSSSASAAAPAAGQQHPPSTASSAAPSFVSVSGPPRRNRWGGDAGVGIQNDHGGGVIALSNTKRTAMLVERYTTTNIVDDDAMAELRARLGIAAPAPPPAPAPAPAADAGGAGGGSDSAAPGSAASDANPQQPAHQQAQQQFIPSTIGGMAITLPGHGIGSGSGGVSMSNVQLPMGMQPSGLVSMPILAAAAAAATGGPSGAAATANIAGAQMMALPGLAALGGGGGNLGLGLGLGMPSGLSSITGTAANVNVQVGSSPAQAAGMLGPGGIVSLLAAVTPTRILVLLNAVSDIDFKATDHADVLADIACEAQKHGVLLRAVMPLPKPGESLEPTIERPEILKKVGAAGLLEDSREALAGGSAAQMNVPKNAQEFYKRTMGGPDARGNAGVASSGYRDDGDEGGEDEWVPGQNPFKDTTGRTKGLGRIFLEFQDATAATAAQKELSGRFFNGRILVATFADERKFMRGDLCDLSQPGCDVVAGTEMVD